MQYKYLRITSNEGRCERCGTNCPKRRVEVQPVDENGASVGEIQFWGVNCAAFARYGSKSRKHQDLVLSEIRVEQERREYAERQRLARVAVPGQSYSFGPGAPSVICGDGGESRENLANRLYNRTRRQIVGSYFARGPQGETVRVDGGDAEDVSFFAARGYAPVSKPVEAAS